MSIDKDRAEVNDVDRAREWADREIRAAGLDPDGQEAAFHRFRTMAFGTMGVQPPGDKQAHGKSRRRVSSLD